MRPGDIDADVDLEEMLRRYVDGRRDDFLDRLRTPFQAAVDF